MSETTGPMSATDMADEAAIAAKVHSTDRPGTGAFTPAYYARKGGLWADFWTILHPPYTIWNLSFVAMGAALAPVLDWRILALMLAAFLAGTGVASHALDELNGRPLRTGFSDRALKLMALAALTVSLACALLSLLFVSAWIILLALFGALLVAAYSLEWFGGLLHTNLGFALSWGGYPVLVGYWAQTESVTPGVFLLATAATFMSLAQRELSTPARFLRRKVSAGEATFATAEGVVQWNTQQLLACYERPLRLLSWMAPALGAAMLLAKLGW